MASRGHVQIRHGWVIVFVFLAAQFRHLSAQDDSAKSRADLNSFILDANTLERLPFEQLGQFVAWELQQEEQRAPEDLLHFGEFQDVAEFDCETRLLYLLNQTITARDQIQSYHSDILGLSGLFMHLLQKAPEENSWIWLLTNSHERILQKVHTYWSKVVALALDQNHCLIAEVRKIVLDAVAHWKKLHADIVALMWNGFAFGGYSGAAAIVGSDSNMKENHDLKSQSHDRILSDNVVAGNMWTSTMRAWFEQYTNELFKVLFSVKTSDEQQHTGATRLHQDKHGSFVTYEFYRRKVFGQWAIDKGLLRGLLRYVWKPPYGSVAPMSIADFGAGGGHYSTWLNETGLVHAYAFDGTAGAAELTEGVVQEINLVEEAHLWRMFDWVMCLEVGEHVPKEYASVLLQNLRRHAQKGIVMSWSDDWEGIGHVNCLPQAEFVKFVEGETGFLFDNDTTQAVKESCEIEYIARTIAVFRAPM